MKRIHALSNVDVESKTAICSICGPTDIRIRTSGQNVCRTKQRELKRASYKVHAERGSSWIKGTSKKEKEKKELRDSGTCALCGTTENLVVDHDHETGFVRGILCHPHNVALGFFSDNIAHMAAAIEYLKEPPLAHMKLQY